MKKHRILLTTLCITVLIGAVGLGYPMVSHHAVEAKTKTMVGSWDAKIIVPGAIFNCLITMTGDGVIFGNDPAPWETTAHGNWVSSGKNQVKYTFMYIITTDALVNSNEGKVVGEFNYDPQADSISGPFQLTEFDPQGNVISAAEGTITGTRIQIEDLK